MNRTARNSAITAVAAAALLGSVTGGPLAAAAQEITKGVNVVAHGFVSKVSAPADDQVNVVAHNFMGS